MSDRLLAKAGWSAHAYGGAARSTQETFRESRYRSSFVKKFSMRRNVTEPRQVGVASGIIGQLSPNQNRLELSLYPARYRSRSVTMGPFCAVRVEHGVEIELLITRERFPPLLHWQFGSRLHPLRWM